MDRGSCPLLEIVVKSSVPHDAVVVCVSWGSGRRLLLGAKQKGRRVKYIRK